MSHRVLRAAVLVLLFTLVLIPRCASAQHAYPSAWFTCRLTLSASGTVQHRVCRTHPITRHHRPIVGWEITRSRLSARIERSVRYPRFQPPPVDVSTRARPYVTPWLPEIASAARLTSVPTRVIAAIMMVETRGQHTCTSGDGLSSGLMQVQPSTAASMWARRGLLLSVTSAAYQLCHDVTFDVESGALYLQYQFSRYGSWYTAAGAYNAGSWSGSATNYTYANQFTYWETD